jgi:hypothetical protein
LTHALVEYLGRISTSLRVYQFGIYLGSLLTVQTLVLALCPRPASHLFNGSPWKWLKKIMCPPGQIALLTYIVWTCGKLYPSQFPSSQDHEDRKGGAGSRG